MRTLEPILIRNGSTLEIINESSVIIEYSLIEKMEKCIDEMKGNFVLIESEESEQEFDKRNFFKKIWNASLKYGDDLIKKARRRYGKKYESKRNLFLDRLKSEIPLINGLPEMIKNRLASAAMLIKSMSLKQPDELSKTIDTDEKIEIKKPLDKKSRDQEIRNKIRAARERADKKFDDLIGQTSS